MLKSDLVLSSLANLSRHFLPTVYRALCGMQYKWDTITTSKECCHWMRRQNPLMGQSKVMDTKTVYTWDPLHISTDTIYGAQTERASHNRRCWWMCRTLPWARVDLAHLWERETMPPGHLLSTLAHTILDQGKRKNRHSVALHPWRSDTEVGSWRPQSLSVANPSHLAVYQVSSNFCNYQIF